MSVDKLYVNTSEVEEGKIETSKQKADKQRYLSLRKLWKLQIFIFILLAIAALALEIYMGNAGYKGFRVRIQHARTTVHSFSFLLLAAYAFVIAFLSVNEIRGLLRQYPDWKGLPTKGVPFPKEELVKTVVALIFVLILGTIDLAGRKPEPKVDTPNFNPELWNDLEQEKNNSYSKLIQDLEFPSREEESQASVSD